MTLHRTLHRSLLASASLTLTLALAPIPTTAAPGDVDVTYAKDGVLFIDGPFKAHDEVRALLPLPDGGVVAAGTMENLFPTSGDLALVRLDASGQLVGGFGTGGIALLDAGGDQDIGYALLRQPDGKIVVAGSLEADSYLDFGIARFHADGTRDDGFGLPDGKGGRLGYALANAGDSPFVHDEARGVARQSDGKLVLAGRTEVDEDGSVWNRTALLRFHPDGTRDTSFGASGLVIAPMPEVDELATALALRADGSLPPDNSITVVGYGFAAGFATVRRYTANGSPDASLDGDGLLVIPHLDGEGDVVGLETIEAAVLQDDGKLLVTGHAGDRGFTVMRFHHDGRRDTGFGSNGRVTVKFSGDASYDQAAALALQPDGSILVAGYATQGDDHDFAVVRLRPNGQPDPGFGDGAGRSRWPLSLHEDQAQAVAVAANGGLLAAGWAYRDDSELADMAFLRLEGDTTLFRDGFESD